MADKIFYFIAVLFILLLSKWLSLQTESTFVGIIFISTLMILGKLNENQEEK